MLWDFCDKKNMFIVRFFLYLDLKIDIVVREFEFIVVKGSVFVDLCGYICKLCFMLLIVFRRISI